MSRGATWRIEDLKQRSQAVECPSSSGLLIDSAPISKGAAVRAARCRKTLIAKSPAPRRVNFISSKTGAASMYWPNRSAACGPFSQGRQAPPASCSSTDRRPGVGAVAGGEDSGRRGLESASDELAGIEELKGSWCWPTNRPTCWTPPLLRPPAVRHPTGDFPCPDRQPEQIFQIHLHGPAGAPRSDGRLAGAETDGFTGRQVRRRLRRAMMKALADGSDSRPAGRRTSGPSQRFSGDRESRPAGRKNHG